LRSPNGADLSNLFRHRSTALFGLPLSATIYPTLAVMANSMAVLVAFAAWEAVERMGLPEAKYNLAHATVYVATSPKSSSTSVAISAALEDVKSNRTLPMSEQLHDKQSPGTGKKFLYKHPKDYPNNFVAQNYLGVDTIFYDPSEQGQEKEIKGRIFKTSDGGGAAG
jgi:putative ATPase